MNKIIYKHEKNLDNTQVFNLYHKSGWTSYTDDMSKLMDGISNSLDVITAWQDNDLVGLIRVVGDGSTIMYVQDILVLPEYKRKGIGSTLFKIVIDKYSSVRQKVLITEDSEETRRFYEANGFIDSNEYGVVSFVKFN